MAKMNRRNFIKMAGVAIAAVVLPACKEEDDVVNPSMERTKDDTINVGSNAAIDDLPDGKWGPWSGEITGGQFSHNVDWAWNAAPPVSSDMHELWNISDGLWLCERDDGDFNWFVWNEDEWQEFSVGDLPTLPVPVDDECLIATHYLTDGSVVCLGDEGSMIKTFDMGETWYEIEHISDNGWLSVEDMEEVEF